MVGKTIRSSRRQDAGRIGGMLIALLLAVGSAPAAERMDDASYEALTAGVWQTDGSDPAGAQLGWVVRDGRVFIAWPSGSGVAERALKIRVRDAQSGSDRSFVLTPRATPMGSRVHLTERIEALGVDVDVALESVGARIEGVARLRGLTTNELPLRIEIALDAPGDNWTWWDDGRRSRAVTGNGEYANLTRVLAGYDGQMSRYPLACLTSPEEALVFAVPMSQPRVFQLVYDAANAEFRLAVDVALSPETEKFPNEAAFFFVLYSSDSAQGFRSAFAHYMRINADAFVKRVEHEGIWMPFTRVNDVRDAQDFGFGFHEYGAVDFEYNRNHDILSFLYVEPWTYWMAMPPETPRTIPEMMGLLDKNAVSGDAWNKPMAQATVISAIHDANGEPASQFVKQPWSDGALFFNNSDPDIPVAGAEGMNAGSWNLDVARREVVERERTIVPGWDAFAEGYEIDKTLSRDKETGSLRMERASGAPDRGAVQLVQLDQDVATPVWFKAYSRAEGVAEGAAINYSLYADVAYQNGSNSWGHAVGFSAGTHPWEPRVLVIIPDAPIKTVKLHALLRTERTGRAWFDDFELKEIPVALAREILPSVWEDFAGGYSVDSREAHSGKRSIRVDRKVMEPPGGALQRVQINQTEPAPLILRGWSRTAERSATGPDNDYAIHADVIFADGSAEFGVMAPFENSVNWRSLERRYEPDRPVASINLHVVFRGAHTGTVWFDDLSVVDAASGREYVVDGGFERVGSAGHEAELAEYPNRLRDGVFAAAPIELRADGMYLDSMEGWANRLNFRRSHFSSVDVPLAYETGSGRTAIFNLFSIFEFTKAMSDYLHDNNRLLMGNWVLIDFPFLGGLLDVPGKEVHWLNANNRFEADTDDVMLYRRMLSGKKPYPLLLNVKFEHFTSEMMRKYFDRSLFYAFYPGMFSHDAATNPYFENPSNYNRDRSLFLRYVPLIRELSTAGWEPITRATSSHPQMLVERYGSDPQSGLYFAIHHDGEGWGEALIEIDVHALSLTNRVRLLDVMTGKVIGRIAPADRPQFRARLGDYGTQVVRVLKDTPESLFAYAAELAPPMRVVIARHEEQGKLAHERAVALRALTDQIEDDIRSPRASQRLRALDAVRRLRLAPEEADREDFVSAAAALENALSDAIARSIGLDFDVALPDVLALPAESAVSVTLANNGGYVLGIRSIDLTFDPPGRVSVVDSAEVNGALHPRQSLHREVRFSAPLSASEDTAYNARVAVSATWTASDGMEHSFVLARTIRAGVVSSFEMRLIPPRARSAALRTEWLIEVANHRDRATDVPLRARVEGPGAAMLSWTATTARVEAGSVGLVTLSVATPEPEQRATYSIVISAGTANNEWGSVTGALLRFQTSKNLLSDSNVEVRVDSTFAGYSLAPLRDGITDTTGLDWSESAWASSDISVPHWVEARWKSPTPIHRVAIYWAEDGGAYFRSENYRLQYRADGAWVDWPETDRESTATVDTYGGVSPVTTDGIRLWQEAGGGHAARPDLLWLRELEVR